MEAIGGGQLKCVESSFQLQQGQRGSPPIETVCITATAPLDTLNSPSLNISNLCQLPSPNQTVQSARLRVSSFLHGYL